MNDVQTIQNSVAGLRTVRGGWVQDSRGAWIVALTAAYVLASVAISSQLFSDGAGGDALAANPVSRLIKLTVLALGGLIVIWRLKLALLLLRRLNPGLILFLVIAPLSWVWSISRGDTLARFVSILSMAMICSAVCLFGWYAQRFQKIIRPTLTVLIIASIAYALAFPLYGIEQGIGTLHNAWRGITSQKNQFGELTSFSVLFWLHAGIHGQTKRWQAIVFGTMSFVGVLLSRSSASLMSTVFASTFMLLLYGAPPNLRRYMPYFTGTFATIIVIYATAVLKIVPGLDVLLTPVTAFTGKDLTFSNRSEIWVIIKEHILESPWIGTGYGAYWTGYTNGSPSAVFLSRMYFYPFESHNGYIEIINDLGFLGLGILLSYLLFFVRQSLQLMKIDRPQGILYLGLFFQQGVLNLSETSWLSITSGFPFFIMTLASLMQARNLLDHDLRRFFGTPESAAAPASRF